MKKMKKILSVILTLAMVLGMSVTTFATGGETPPATPTTPPANTNTTVTSATGTPSDRGTITIHGFLKKADGKKADGTTNWVIPSGLTIKAYPIIEAEYKHNESREQTDEKDQNGNPIVKGKNDGSFSNYKVVYDELDNPIALTDDDGKALSEVSITEPQLTAIWNHIAQTNKTAKENPTGETKEIAPAVPAITLEGNLNQTVAVGKENIKILAEDSVASGEDPTFAITIPNLPVGSYLVVVSGTDEIYNPIVASIYYDVTETKDADDNVIKNENNMTNDGLTLSNYRMKTDNNWVKVTKVPSISKTIVEKTGTAPDYTITNQNHGSANIGDEIEYQVVINPIPEYGGDYPALKVVDTLSKGLAYQYTGSDPKSGVEVKIYESGANLTDKNDLKLSADNGKLVGTFESAKYDVTATTDADNITTLTVDFAKNGVYGLSGTNNEYVGKMAVITYKAKLTDGADDNEEGNENEAKLNFTRDSRTSQKDGDKDVPVTEEVDSKTYSYTFDIDGGVFGDDASITEGMLTKTGEDIDPEDSTKKKPLAGAEFTLFKDAGCKIAYGNESIVNPNAKEDADKYFKGVVTSNSNGRLPIRGLKEGTYYLKETKAPEGYSLNGHIFKIEIVATYHNEDGQEVGEEGSKVPQYKKGELASWMIIIDGQKAADGDGYVEDIGTTNIFVVDHEKDSSDKKVLTNPTKENPEAEYTDGSIKNVGIQNTKIVSLPSTGGIGTTIFTFGGCAIMILAAALFFISRRKSAK